MRAIYKAYSPSELKDYYIRPICKGQFSLNHKPYQVGKEEHCKCPNCGSELSTGF